MNENENVLDGFQISGIVCFVLALIFFLVGFFVGIDTGDIFIFCVVLSILLIIIGNILFSICKETKTVGWGSGANSQYASSRRTGK